MHQGFVGWNKNGKMFWYKIIFSWSLLTWFRNRILHRKTIWDFDSETGVVSSLLDSFSSFSQTQFPSVDTNIKVVNENFIHWINLNFMNKKWYRVMCFVTRLHIFSDFFIFHDLVFESFLTRFFLWRQHRLLFAAIRLFKFFHQSKVEQSTCKNESRVHWLDVFH